MSKTYDYNADGRLRFSSDLIDHRFDRSYSFDHAGRISAALSGAEARGESATDNRPYKQLYSYDGFSHLTERTQRWWSVQQNSSDSYTNNRHNQVGQLYQFDADGRMTSGEYVAYEYDAAGRANTVWSSSTATLGLDGDGQQVKSAETVYDPQTQTDVTTTKYYLRSTVLGGEVLTELESDGYYSRAFVYAGGAVLATQERWGGSEQVSWEHRDPSNASYRTSAVGNPVGVQAELDPVGANKGVSDPAYQQSIPDEGALAPYPSFNNPAQPNMTYSIDGVRVPLDHFMVMFNLNFKSNLYLAEQVAGASTPSLTSYSVSRFHGRLIRDFGLNLDRAHDEALEQSNLTRNWLVDSNWDFDPSLLPQNNRTPLSSQAVGILENDVNTLLKNEICAKFVAGVLKRLGSNLNATQLFNAVKNQPLDARGYGGFGRNLQSTFTAQASGAIAYGNPEIDINFNIDPALANVPVFMRDRGLIVLHEMFHLAGSGANHWQMHRAGYAVATEMHLNLKGEPPSTDPTQGTTDPNYPEGVEFNYYLGQACK
jgi:hypothetical protein